MLTKDADTISRFTPRALKVARIAAAWVASVEPILAPTVINFGVFNLAISWL